MFPPHLRRLVMFRKVIIQAAGRAVKGFRRVW
nr:MAG TPA: hypothetical protein [Caudoviricetes sp.]